MDKYLGLAYLLDAVHEDMGFGEPGENACIDSLHRAVKVAKELATELDEARAYTESGRMWMYHADTRDIEEIVRILLGQPYARCSYCTAIYIDEGEVGYIKDRGVCTVCQESIDIAEREASVES